MPIRAPAACQLEKTYSLDWQKPLGQGTFATVYSAVHRFTGRQAAVKAMDLPKSANVRNYHCFHSIVFFSSEGEWAR